MFNTYLILFIYTHFIQDPVCGGYGCGVFIDLQKAFDTVNHSMLLKKLEHYGMKGTALKCFTSYLTDRQQYLSVNAHCSN